MVITATQLIQKIALKTGVLQDTSTWTPQDGTYDPVSGGVTGGSAPIPGVGCVPDKYSIHLIDGDHIRAGDLRLIVPVPTAGLTFTPTERFSVSFRGDTWQVVNVSPLTYRAVVVAYDCQLRR